VQKTRLSTRTGAIVRAEINGQKDDKRIKRQHREKTLGIAYNYLYICGFGRTNLRIFGLSEQIRILGCLAEQSLVYDALEVLLPTAKEDDCIVLHGRTKGTKEAV
jgi:hypothetical protein